jgi:hypothetical protein
MLNRQEILRAGRTTRAPSARGCLVRARLAQECPQVTAIRISAVIVTLISPAPARSTVILAVTTPLTSHGPDARAAAR